MAATHIWKVYRGDEYIASCKEPMYAGMIVASIGTHDMTIRYGHNYVVWHEGFEDIPASESYDIVTETCRKRAFQKQAQNKHSQTESRK